MNRNKPCRNGHTGSHFVDAHGRKDCKTCSQDRYKRYANRIFYSNNRELAIKRDGEQCLDCGMTREEHLNKYGMDITVDHIDGLGVNTPVDDKNNELDNLQTLCLACHGSKDRRRYLEMVV